jgi:hypothetical protein
VHGRAAVAYSNNKGGLTLDLAQRLRTLAIDANPAAGPAGPITQFRAALTNVAVCLPADVDASMLFAVPDEEPAADQPEASPDDIAAQAANGSLGARLVSTGESAELIGGASLAAGRYRIYAEREGVLRRTGVTFTVGDDDEMTFG